MILTDATLADYHKKAKAVAAVDPSDPFVYRRVLSHLMDGYDADDISNRNQDNVQD